MASTLRIDLYKKGSFILEAKQSKANQRDDQLSFFKADEAASTAAAEGRWDMLMRNARKQAEDYVFRLPADHPAPPFIIVCDVGYPNARRPDWPDAEFIVGNPPFIAASDFRYEFGSPYAETLWHVNGSAGFVMFWWDRAAEILLRKKSQVRRFGFVTTNSISQVFLRRVVEAHISAKSALSIVFLSSSPFRTTLGSRGRPEQPPFE